MPGNWGQKTKHFYFPIPQGAPTLSWVLPWVSWVFMGTPSGFHTEAQREISLGLWGGDREEKKAAIVQYLCLLRDKG